MVTLESRVVNLKVDKVDWAGPLRPGFQPGRTVRPRRPGPARKFTTLLESIGRGLRENSAFLRSGSRSQNPSFVFRANKFQNLEKNFQSIFGQNSVPILLLPNNSPMERSFSECSSAEKIKYNFI